MHNKSIGSAAAALILLLLSQPGLAQQEQAPPDSEQQAPEPAATAQRNDSEGAAPAGAPDQSPFEYESSEQISEDLSVSFPVDIQEP